MIPVLDKASRKLLTESPIFSDLRYSAELWL